MAKQQPRDDGPSLELPSFGLRRKRRQRPVDPAPEPGPDFGVEEQRATEAPQEPVRPVEPETSPARTEVTADTRDDPAATTGATRPRRRATSGLSLPSLDPRVAVTLTGVVVGLLVVGLTWGSLRLCELVSGTSSCGNPGFFLLLAIMVAMVLLGRLLLGALGVDEPGPTSFLGVCLVAMVLLVFLAELLFSWWMVLAVPALGLVAFLGAHWVTSTFAGPEVGDSSHR